MQTHRTPQATEVKDRARGNWRSILNRLGISENYLMNRHGPCPCCGGKDRFRFDDKDGNGTFYCNNCGSGNGLDLVIHSRNCSFKEALSLVADIVCGASTLPAPITPAVSQETLKAPDMKRYQRIVSLWEEGTPVTHDDPAGRYLTLTRGLQLSKFPDCLRFHPRCWTKVNNEQKCFPTLLARFDDTEGQITQLQRIFLTTTGEKALSDTKRLMPAWKQGAMRGGAIRLYAPHNLLAVAEGVETALGYHIWSGGTPVWATYSANLLEQVVVPPSVTKVVVIADNDSSGQGQKSADVLAVRLFKEGREVRIVTPRAIGMDFADIAGADR
jgi:putative DNA primase/helicase